MRPATQIGVYKARLVQSWLYDKLENHVFIAQYHPLSVLIYEKSSDFMDKLSNLCVGQLKVLIPKLYT